MSRSLLPAFGTKPMPLITAGWPPCCISQPQRANSDQLLQFALQPSQHAAGMRLLNATRCGRSLSSMLAACCAGMNLLQ